MEKEIISYARKELGYEKFIPIFRKKNSRDFVTENIVIIAERYNKKILYISRLCMGSIVLSGLAMVASAPLMHSDIRLAAVLFSAGVSLAGPMLMLTGMISKQLKEFAWIDVDGAREGVKSDKVNLVLREVNDYYKNKGKMPEIFEILIVSEGGIDAGARAIHLKNKIRFFEKSKTGNSLQEI
ncbi:MAG TPA: hypothetical protein PLI16_05545 [Bacteroidales bacterium]|jgi:hypothetical protein|nr:hypothetical protein [Bacteroidales bacterium]HNZ42299.1 hypothetical protein [Bacteroidales bacterium]HOH84058.1 hypothetical protein [Bacteroidales bacterium]HPB24863.1 hypothetical protein [Bacteroidales bacterium]HPI29495.1 hypothetical protein [Bacteroidales bacterium]